MASDLKLCLGRQCVKTKAAAALVCILWAWLFTGTMVTCARAENPVGPESTVTDRNLPPLMIELGHSHLIRTRVPVIRASIADPDTANVRIISPDQVLVVANPDKAGSTTLILWQDEHQAQNVDIQVYATVNRSFVVILRDRLKRIAPGVNVEVMSAGDEPKNGTLILTGEVVSQEKLDKVLKTVDAFNFEYVNLVNITGPQQVQLKVVIAEVSKSGLKQMGLNFYEKDFSLGNGASSTGNRSFETGSGSLLSVEQTISSPFDSAFQVAVNAADGNWLVLLGILKNQGLSKYLATPTLVAMNGQDASFTVGGSYPVPVENDNGGTDIEDKEYGIILNFTPYIVDNETIILKVAPEVSTPDYSLGVSSGGTTVPGLATRKASTTLELKNGQCFAMAGLLKEESYVTVNKVPLLGDIPGLGVLFTSKETENTEVELVIMVTPQIVQPLNSHDMPQLPGQTMGDKISDFNFYLKNDLDLPDESFGSDRAFKGETGFAR